VMLRGGADPLDHGNGGLRAGEIIEVVTAGSGGYGPPAERDPMLIQRDIAEDRIDAEAATVVYPQHAAKLDQGASGAGETLRACGRP
jgi:N-methylhydantoinase B